MKATLYVKSRDGETWHVGLKPMNPDGFDKVAGYIYCARAWSPAENFEHAMRYARACAASPYYPAYYKAPIVVENLTARMV